MCQKARLEEIKNNGVCVCLHLETKYKYEKTAAAAVLCMCMNFFAPCIKRKLLFIYMREEESWKTLQLSNLSILPASAETVALCCQKMAKKLAWWRPIHLKFLVERNLIGDNYFIYSLHLLASFFLQGTLKISVNGDLSVLKSVFELFLSMQISHNYFRKTNKFKLS